MNRTDAKHLSSKNSQRRTRVADITSDVIS